jgi:hypothetical protein
MLENAHHFPCAVMPQSGDSKQNPDTNVGERVEIENMFVLAKSVHVSSDWQ